MSNRQNQIKVFKPNSKRADFTIRSVTPQAGAKRLQDELGDKLGELAERGFRSLATLGAETMTFHAAGRKIKLMAAHSS